MSCASATKRSVPGCPRSAASTIFCAAGSDGGGWAPTLCAATGPDPGPGRKTWTGCALVWSRPATMSRSEEVSPTANETAVAPSTTAESVSRLRPGRANGAARPIETERGSGSRPSSRWARYPRPTRGARPVAIAATGLSRPARSAGISAARPARLQMPAGTARSTQTGTWRLPTPNAVAVLARSGIAMRLPRATPAAQPASAGTATWPTYAAATSPGVKPMLLRMPIRR